MSYFPSGETELIAREGYGDLGASWSDIKSGASDVLGGALSFYGESQKTAGQAAAYEEMARIRAAAGKGKDGDDGMPKWLLPVALGGGALVLFLALRRRK